MTTINHDPTERPIRALSAADADDFTPEAPMYKHTGRPLARWTITGGGQAVNYAKPS